MTMLHNRKQSNVESRPAHLAPSAKMPKYRSVLVSPFLCAMILIGNEIVSNRVDLYLLVGPPRLDGARQGEALALIAVQCTR